MPSSILITQCLQNDFVNPIGKTQPLPNALHVGHDEARRLMGEDPAEGPVTRLMEWAYAQPGLRIVHIRDWHDPAAPEQREHLDHYGRHCLADTDGAAFCFPRPGDAPDLVVDSPGLNDFIGTGLAERLAVQQDARVGIVGVWTEAKVTFLAYELRTRWPHLDIAVCSALTAGSSRTQHFLALDQLRRLLHVRIFDSIGDFTEWLAGTEASITPPKAHGVTLHSDRPLDDDDARLVQYLFRDCRSVDATTLGGGFSGNRVLRTRSVDILGHEQVPHVVKLGPRAVIGQERTAFERVEAVLGNSAPRVADFADFGVRGAIKYRYAAMGAGAGSTFQKRYQQGMGDERTDAILREVFEDQLGRLYAAATREPVDLLAHYGFAPSYAPRVARRIEALGVPRSDLPSFYEDLVALPPGFSCYLSYVHGDLNGANIVLDDRDNVWLIDFFHTARGHVLKDLVKLENDLLYIFTPVTDLEDAMRLTDALLAPPTLADPVPEADLRTPEMRRAWRTVRTLRSFHPPVVREDTSPLQLHVAQLRYAVHTLAFDESTNLQKRWALYTAERLARAIRGACLAPTGG